MPKSLRDKIAVVYLVGLVLMLGVGAVNWRYLQNLSDMTRSGEKVSVLFETTLEVRRFEKNYFLYGKGVDYDSLLAFVGDAEDIVREREKELSIFATPETLSDFKSHISRYRALLEKAPRDPRLPASHQWEGEVREEGKSFVTIAEGMSKSERRIMQETLGSSRRSLALSVFLIMSVWLISGVLFYRTSIKPLGWLEEHMKKVAGGEFAPLPSKYKDREMLSLNSAFNRMLVELEWRQNQLVQSEKLASFGTLLFGVAHEINNPLSNISTSCQILAEEVEEGDVEYKKELLRQIEDETDRAKEIVRSLLDYSRAGKREAVNLRRAAEESIRFIRGEAPAKVEISLNIPGDIEVFADKQRLQQVFLNLIKNALEAMGETGRISVAARTVGERDETVEVDISDTGPGIPGEVVEKIFDPFFTTKEARKGYGLGLFIVHKIIKEHGGSINVYSRPGRGTTFIITLPLKEHRDGK